MIDPGEEFGDQAQGQIDPGLDHFRRRYSGKGLKYPGDDDRATEEERGKGQEVGEGGDKTPGRLAREITQSADKIYQDQKSK